MSNTAHFTLAAPGTHDAGSWRLAESICLMTLREQPTHMGMLLLLGVIANQLGKPEEAIARFNEAIALQPDYLESYVLLGALLRQQRRLEEAVGCLRKAIALKPDDPRAHAGLGDVLADRAQLDEAVASYLEALSLKPDFAEVYCNLGGILQTQGRFAEAVDACNMALSLNPHFAGAYVNLGATHQGLGDLAAAEACFNRALALDDKCTVARNALASVCAELGKFDAARRELERTLALKTDDATALAMLTEIGTMPADEAWLDKAQNVVVSPALSKAEALRLQFAIAKYYDDNKQYQLAFPEYRRANALRAKPGGFDRAAFSAVIDALIAAYTREVVNQEKEGMNKSHRPVLVVGMPRSGTSLMEQIVASLPQAFGAGELDFWPSQAQRNWKSALSAQKDPALLARLGAEYEELLKRVSDGRDRVVDKMPANFLWMGFVRSVFPFARFIHTTRDPLDTCLSIYFKNFSRSHYYATDLADLGFYYTEYARLMRHWRSVLPEDRFLEVSYEALIGDQSAWSKRIVEFVDLPWDTRCLDFHRTERRVATFSNWEVRQPIFRSSMGRWKNYREFLGPLIETLAAEPPPENRYATGYNSSMRAVY
jgi:tetratricopeptide (TPR) repeat protein